VPQLITFQGAPVKRRQRTAQGLLQLVFFDPIPGHPGKRLVVSQADWERFGQVQFFGLRELPDVRALARTIR